MLPNRFLRRSSESDLTADGAEVVQRRLPSNQQIVINACMLPMPRGEEWAVKRVQGGGLVSGPVCAGPSAGSG